MKQHNEQFPNSKNIIPQTLEYTLISGTHELFMKINDVLHHRASVKFKG